MAARRHEGAGAGAGAHNDDDLDDDDPYEAAAAAAIERDGLARGVDTGAGTGVGAGAGAHDLPQPPARAAPRGSAGGGAGAGLGGPAAPADMDFAAAAAFVAASATDVRREVDKAADKCVRCGPARVPTGASNQKLPMHYLSQLKTTAKGPLWRNDMAIVRVREDGTIELIDAHPGVDKQLRQAFAHGDIQRQFVAMRDAVAATDACQTITDVQRLLSVAKSESVLPLRRVATVPN